MVSPGYVPRILYDAARLIREGEDIWCEARAASGLPGTCAERAHTLHSLAVSEFAPMR